MKYFAYGVATAGMVAVAATAVSWAAEAPGNANPADTAANTAGQASAPVQPPQAAAPGQSAPSQEKNQALASSPTCPPAPVHRHVAYHHRVVHSTVRSETYAASYGGYSTAGSYGAQYTVAAAPPPPPAYYPPPPMPVWYASWPRPWFGGPWHHWWHRRWW